MKQKSKLQKHLDDHDVTLYQVLQEMGYESGKMGSWPSKMNGRRYLTRDEAELLLRAVVKLTKSEQEIVKKFVRAEKYKIVL